MADQTVPSLTDRLAAYMVEAFLDGRGYDPGDKIDVEVTLKEGFHTVLTEMREDQAAGTATYDGIVPAPPPDRVPEGPERPEAAEAIAIIEDSRRTHVEWLDYLAKHGGDLRPHEEIAGDADHHREAIEKYDRVLAVLRRPPAPDSERPDTPDAVKYEAEKVMDPILRRWFAIDLDPIDVEHNAENAAVDLSWALEGAGLLNNPTIIDEDGVDHICAALIEVGPWDEIDGDGTEASIIADHIRDLGRLVPTEVAQDQVDWRVMALRVKHENAGPECFCENPKPGAHAQSCPRFGMNP